jgi:hypothetical protein
MRSLVWITSCLIPISREAAERPAAMTYTPIDQGGGNALRFSLLLPR